MLPNPSGLCALSQACKARGVMYDSSDDEKDPKEAAKKYGPAPIPPSASRPTQPGRRRRRVEKPVGWDDDPDDPPAPAAAPAAKEPRTQGDGPVDHVFSNDDLVAIVLSMIASRDTQKVDACRAATKLCSVNKTTEAVCAAFPSVWRTWSRSIFESPEADKL